MAYKDKQKQFDNGNNYNSKNYDRVNIMLPKGGRDELRAIAERAGESVNVYVKGAIKMRMEKEREV